MVALGGCASGVEGNESAGEATGAQAVGESDRPAEGASALAAAVTTEANLKIAFVGDTASGTNWGSVSTLIKNEGAQAVMVAGDMTYNANPEQWWTKTESTFGQSFPVFLARGNHDDGTWTRFLPEANNHLGGATRTSGPHNAAYKTVFKGLSIVNIRKSDTNTTINNLFSGDTATWKICGWHQNMSRMQVGGKGDEMGWPVYEACRQKGAIIVTGHEHSYHRTKTMTNTQTQTIDGTCSSGSSLCVGPGRTFVTVVGTGGTGLRSQMRCTPTAGTAPFAYVGTETNCKIWASIYTTSQPGGAAFGALFITFNVDGNPKKARGYFKNIAGTTIDSFTIFAD
jgi:predicted phosphodiesterase